MSEKAQLAVRVFYIVFDSTESFEPDNIGSDLAYLLGAILVDGTCTFDSDSAIMRILRSSDDEVASDVIRNYIDVTEAGGADSDEEELTEQRRKDSRAELPADIGSALEKWKVLPCFPLQDLVKDLRSWHAVDDADSGVVAYFVSERDALAWRLFQINLDLNERGGRK